MTKRRRKYEEAKTEMEKARNAYEQAEAQYEDSVVELKKYEVTLKKQKLKDLNTKLVKRDKQGFVECLTEGCFPIGKNAVVVPLGLQYKVSFPSVGRSKYPDEREDKTEEAWFEKAPTFRLNIVDRGGEECVSVLVAKPFMDTIPTESLAEQIARHFPSDSDIGDIVLNGVADPSVLAEDGCDRYSYGDWDENPSGVIEFNSEPDEWTFHGVAFWLDPEWLKSTCSACAGLEVADASKFSDDDNDINCYEEEEDYDETFEPEPFYVPVSLIRRLHPDKVMINKKHEESVA